MNYGRKWGNAASVRGNAARTDWLENVDFARPMPNLKLQHTIHTTVKKNHFADPVDRERFFFPIVV
jgi:hypothetical protein